jgi:hypothetical protein
VENNKSQNFIANNWSIIVGILTVAFAAGGIFSEFRLMRTEHAEDKRQLESKIEQLIKERERKNDWLEEQEQRIDDLEEWRAFEEGKKSN